jgi:hypothetical protein
MDDLQFKIQLDNHALNEINADIVLSNLDKEIKMYPKYQDKIRAMSDSIFHITDIIVVLTSASSFTAFYKILCKYLDRNRDKEVTFDNKGTKVTIKGHSLPEERFIISTILPDLKKDIENVNNP